jgi:hypothetical protein
VRFLFGFVSSRHIVRLYVRAYSRQKVVQIIGGQLAKLSLKIRLAGV